MSKKVVHIIGAGIAGLAAAIRMAHAGYRVTVFEKNHYAGGKLSELILGKYRFDKGPSLFTLPELIDELSTLIQYPGRLPYRRIDPVCRYYYPDGPVFDAPASQEELIDTLALQFRENPDTLRKHLREISTLYETLAPLFLEQSIHTSKAWLNARVLRALRILPRLPLIQTMHAANRKRFRNPQTIQFFDRFATYNGSDPYQAPAILNMIPHLEFGRGAFIPELGMHQISTFLLEMAAYMGVGIQLGMPVEKVLYTAKGLHGLQVNGAAYKADAVISDVDMHVLYRTLLPEFRAPESKLRQPKSSSAYVFYWGIKQRLPELRLHNILFTADYHQEFRKIFASSLPDADPTIYINSTVRYCLQDAPEGCDNWFVMINVPHNAGGKPITYGAALREQVQQKIHRMLHVSIDKVLEQEATLDPFQIESQTASFGGSLYGNASNSSYAAFLRHANYQSRLPGLFLAGGSVHPGGGIPLCLYSAKLASGFATQYLNR